MLSPLKIGSELLEITVKPFSVPMVTLPPTPVHCLQISLYCRKRLISRFGLRYVDHHERNQNADHNFQCLHLPPPRQI
jgi:hypothetical protein